jgi:leucyl aminopeptidase
VQIAAVDADVDLSGSTLIAGVLEGLEAAPGSEDVVSSVDSSLFSAADFTGKMGQTVTLPHDEAAALLVIGLGEELSFDSLRAASGNAIRSVNTSRAVSLLARVDIEGATRAVVEGSMLGGYTYRTYKTDEAENAVESLDVLDGDEDEASAGVTVSEVTGLARDWVNTPARDKSPETLAGLIETAATVAGLTADVWDLDRIQEEGLGGVLGVAAGSDRDPRLVILSYAPEGAERHLALVGKGITFDSGGLSIKAAASMMEMKDDMSGAAITAAAAIGIARLGLLLKVTCIMPLTDNAIGGDATRPGDVLRPLEGPTIEVLNTDAEGRLILADGLSLAKRYEPDLTIDVATLTGAARVALGDRIGAVFGSDSEVSKRVLDAASRAGEDFWEMPLYKDYRKSIDSEIADIKNVSSSRYGGAIVAALFLAEYAGDGPWAHLDVAGPARTRETSGDQVKGASGIGVRTLIELAREMSQTA